MPTTSSSSCNYDLDCVGDRTCIDTRCMCNPLWGHTGTDCDGLRWNSWALVVALSLVSVLSVAMLASEAKKLSRGSSYGSGLHQLATMLCRPKGADAGSLTVRVVLVLAAIDIISYFWKMLAALSVCSESTFDYWNAIVFAPLSEGLLILPTAIVVSVWMDVANSSMSRSKSKQKLQRTKKALQIGTAFYTALLFVLYVIGRKEWASMAQMIVTLVGLSACGSGAAKLCSTLRALGPQSARIADNVFEVSRAMGVWLYVMFCAEVMLLSSRTRKSDPANLALMGMAVYSLSKCFLNKSIFKYMVESAARKNFRSRHVEASMVASSPERSTHGEDRHETKHDNPSPTSMSSSTIPLPLSSRPRKVAIEN